MLLLDKDKNCIDKFLQAKLKYEKLMIVINTQPQFHINKKEFLGAQNKYPKTEIPLPKWTIGHYMTV